jgi:signal transduction histidine kinase/CheY-like chemotaxis protein
MPLPARNLAPNQLVTNGLGRFVLKRSDECGNPASRRRHSRMLQFARFLALALTLFGLGLFLGIVGPFDGFSVFLADNTKPDSAACFFLSGLALLLGPLGSARRKKRVVAALCRYAVLALVLSQLAANLFGHSDEEFLPSRVAGFFPAGFMAPHTAAALLFDIGAICLLGRGPRRTNASQLLALAGLSVAFFSVIAYLLHAEIFVSIFQGAHLRPLTLAGLLLASASALLARPNRGVVAKFLADDSAGIVARRLFAPAILAPAVIGWIAYTGWRSEYYDAGFACSLLVVGSTGVLCLMTICCMVELHRSERERRRLAEAHLQSESRMRGAREASRMKSDFVANVSHELRTPMNGVLGMTSLLLGSELSPEQREQAETIRQSGDALLSLVNEILDFSKVESGKIDFELKPFSLQACLDEVIALLGTAARRGRVDLLAHVAPGTPATLVGDMARLRQVLINLVGNALKFTDKGEVLVLISSSSLPRRDGRHELEVEVADTGIGISDAAREVIFQPFQQGDNSATRRYGGTGLGLAICRRLVELMGGTIGVTSRVGEGSSFRFTVLLDAAPAEILPQADPLPEPCTLALVATPGRYAGLLQKELEMWGAEVLLLSDPLTLTQLPPCAALVLDREADAIGLAARLQLDPVWTAVPRILLDFDEPLTDGESSLFTKHLLKPMKRSHLAAALRELTGTPAEVQVPSVATQPLMAITHPLRVLLAEDNFINQKVARALLNRFGYRADLAANGVEAVDAVLRQPYDLVLLDIQMPEMDGLEACAVMRRKLPGRCPKIVALTANAFAGAREQYLAQGFDDYLSKPLLPETLQRVLTATPAREPLARTPSTRLLVPSGRPGAK